MYIYTPNKCEMLHLYSGLEYRVLPFLVKLKACCAIFKVTFIALKINKEAFTSDGKIMKSIKLLSSDVQNFLRGNVLEKHKVHHHVSQTGT